MSERRRASSPARRWSSPAPATYTTSPPVSAQAAQPVLLVAAGGEALVERADASRTRRAGSPCSRSRRAPARRSAVAEVEARDRRLLAPARARRRALEARADRPAERVRPPGAARAPATSAREPARRRPHVVVDHRDQVGPRHADAGVARRVRARAARSRRTVRTPGGGDHLRPCGRASRRRSRSPRTAPVEVLRGERGERDLEVVGPVGRRNHHGYQGFRHVRGRALQSRPLTDAPDIALVSLGTTPGTGALRRVVRRARARGGGHAARWCRCGSARSAARCGGRSP